MSIHGAYCVFQKPADSTESLMVYIENGEPLLQSNYID
jgi:hypothetical protein